MSIINKVSNERVRNLAQTLRNSGLAASDTEAIRMAESMTQTETKIIKKPQTTTEEKKVVVEEKKTVIQEPSQILKEEQTEQSKDLDEEIPGSVEVISQEVIQDTNEDISHLTVEQAAGLENVQEETNEDINEINDTPNTDTSSDEKEVDEDVKENEKPETKESKEEKPKRDLSEFREAQVDLGSVFKFGK